MILSGVSVVYLVAVAASTFSAGLVLGWVLSLLILGGSSTSRSSRNDREP
ncbi:MAG: hypothetical protein PHQ40_08705 [Anaerolineaceae bacterium]|nr:hypothetical protein [Anaerolineaceae bacterium]